LKVERLPFPKKPWHESLQLGYDLAMFLADTNPNTPLNAVVSTQDGVTTVLVAFMFVCLVLPSMVKHRPQFYAGLACLAGIIAVHTLMLMFGAFTFGPVVIGFLQLVALLLLVLCVGGLTVKQLAGDMAKAYEVVRRGETEKEIIIPIGDQIPPKAATPPPRKVYKNPPIKTVIDPDDETEDQGIPLS
jgi:hypothetical protein